MKRYPVFIVGAGRSGTTMFRLMLNSHPNIYIPPEAWFFGELVFKFSNKKVLSIDDVKNARFIITSNVRWPDWNCSNEKLDAALDFKSPPTIRELIESVFYNCSKLAEKKIWGEKSPRHSHLISQMREIFPDAKFIHLIRDGRDSSMSIYNRGWWDRSFPRICEHWNSCVKAAIKGRSFPAGQYFEIRYEDLVSNPQEILEKVCIFLNIKFYSSMIQFQKRIENDVPEREKQLHDSLNGGVKNNNSQPKKMNLWQKSVFEIKCGLLNSQLGYAKNTFTWWWICILPFISMYLKIIEAFHYIKVKTIQKIK